MTAYAAAYAHLMELKGGKGATNGRTAIMAETKQRSYRIKDTLLHDAERIAEDRGTNLTQIINDALMLYRDYYYAKEKATVIPEETVRILQSSLNLLEQRINRKTNSILSELAIQQYIMGRIIADGLEVNPLVLDEYRRSAINYLKESNQVFKLTPEMFE